MPDKNTLELRVSGTLPGEIAIKALCDYATVVRQTMDPDLLKRLDAVIVQAVEDAQQGWRRIWTDAGLLK